MVSKNVNDCREKEAMRRYLLASMLYSANTHRLQGSNKHWTRFLQELFKKNRRYG